MEQFGFFFQQQYILVFYWSGRHQRSHQRVCDCHNPFKAQCSRVLDVKPTPSSQPDVQSDVILINQSLTD